METTSTTRGSFFGLIGHFRQEVMRLIRQEVQLAKTEMMEKISKMMRNAVFAAIGGVVAMFGAGLLFLGMGIAAGYGFNQAGLEPGLAYSAGVGGMGLLFAAIGGALVMKGIKAFNAKSLKPQQTIDTMRELAGKPVVHPTEKKQKPKGHDGETRETSDELRKRFENTRHEVERTASELKQRANIGAAVARQVNSHPMRTLAAGMATGFVGARVLKNRFNRTHRVDRRAERLAARVEKLEARRPFRRTLLDRLLSRA